MTRTEPHPAADHHGRGVRAGDGPESVQAARHLDPGERQPPDRAVDAVQHVHDQRHHRGNSGSPVFDEERQIVGLVFDGNIQSLGGDYGLDATVNRAISVDSAALLEAIDHVYWAKRIVAEFKGAPGSSNGGRDEVDAPHILRPVTFRPRLRRGRGWLTLHRVGIQRWPPLGGQPCAHNGSSVAADSRTLRRCTTRDRASSPRRCSTSRSASSLAGAGARARWRAGG